MLTFLLSHHLLRQQLTAPYGPHEICVDDVAGVLELRLEQKGVLCYSCSVDEYIYGSLVSNVSRCGRFY